MKTNGSSKNRTLLVIFAILPVLGVGYLAGHFEIIDSLPYGPQIKQSVKVALGLSRPAAQRTTELVRHVPDKLAGETDKAVIMPVAVRAEFLFTATGKGPRADLYRTTTLAKTRRDPGLERRNDALNATLEDRVQRAEKVLTPGKTDRLLLASSELAMVKPAAPFLGIPYPETANPKTMVSAARSMPVIASEQQGNQRKLDPYEAEKLAIRQAALNPRLLTSGRVFGGLTESEFRRRELRCLATALYFEARGEPLRGQLAVAQVIMNRVRSPEFPDTICGVIFQGESRKNSCQFSFACDGVPDRPSNSAKWAQAKRLARQVAAGDVWLEDIGYSTYYHATYVSPPWRRSMQKIKQIGRHIFYITRDRSATKAWPKPYAPGFGPEARETGKKG